MTELRYLCDKHFSQNYISTQSRRKMLVHTAVPLKEKFSDDLDSVDLSSIKVVGVPVAKKRKLREYDIEVLTTKAKDSNEVVKIVNEVPKLKQNSINLGEGSEVSDISEIPEYNTKHDENYEVVVVQPKSDDFQKSQDQTEVFYYEDETEEHSSFETKEKVVETQKNDLTSLEGYTEFIFGSEKYVQMPKRIFEAEKQKLINETEKYKSIISRLKIFLNKIDS